ncbi:MAG: alpha/beta fold hydrolase [Ruminococcus sp.]|nr:alpha/beta fold hydrolase [Ruminococcus sp.]
MKKALKRTALILAIFLIVSFIIGYIITANEMKKNFGRGEYPDKNLTATWFYDHYENDYPREEVSFRSGDNTLKGFLYGMGGKKGLIVFAHGIGSGHEFYLGLITRLVDLDWSVFAYDCTGSGYSDGEGTKGLAQSLIDLDKALSFTESDSRTKDMDKYVLGHSWGGYAAAAVLNFDHDIKACISMSGYNTPFAELAENCDGSYGMAAKLLYPLVWTYNKVTFGKNSSWSAVDGINKSGIPVLVIHGDNDDVIKYNGASIIAQRDRITNPKAEFYTFSEEKRNGHNSYFNTTEYTEYKENTIIPVQDELNTKYNNDVPYDERVKFYKSIDGELYNGFNPEVISLINSFFEKAA